jgi:hypothetical protein
VVATTSGGVAAVLGYEDHEAAPADEMSAAAARIARGVEVPVTVDAEAGYGMEPAGPVAALRTTGAAGCNLEDTDHTAGNQPQAVADFERVRSRLFGVAYQMLGRAGDAEDVVQDVWLRWQGVDCERVPGSGRVPRDRHDAGLAQRGSLGPRSS